MRTPAVTRNLLRTMLVVSAAAGCWAGLARADEDPASCPGCSPPAVTRETADADQVVNITFRDELSQVVDYYFSVDETCSSAGLVQIAVVELPISGHLSQDTSSEQVFFPADNARSACNGRLSQAVRLYYDRGEEFGGTDNFTVKIQYPDGSTSTIKYILAAKR